MMNHSEGQPQNGQQEECERLQVVDEEQQFTTQLSRSIKRWEIFENGFNYDVVAVLGSQSTGKSTLLNRVFGTTFDVMNEAERRQTTKGIWMCKGKNMDVLVMDVEGADGRERGEDQDFERKAALFSMASAEVIIINMWEHQVGLYQGANMGLLKTVFEVDLALFRANKAKRNQMTSGCDKTHLLFVIRDHVGATPLSNLKATITADLNRLWDELVKPEGTQSSRITDYFDLSFTALSHKVLRPEDFENDVQNFRRRFIEKDHPDYVFKPIYHKRIPADGIAQYLSGIWEAVVTNKDLDLPTQQELLAQFRCDEIESNSYKQFTSSLQATKDRMESGSVLPDLGEKMRDARTNALASFDLAASRYNQGVYQRKRLDFLNKMNATLSPIVTVQLKNLSKVILKNFQEELIKQLKNEARGSARDFGELVNDIKTESEEEFQTAAKLLLLEDTDWNYDEELAQLREDMASISLRSKIEEMKKLINAIQRNAKREVEEVAELALGQHSEEMWDVVLDGFCRTIERSTRQYLSKSIGFSCTDEENAKTIDLITKKSWISLRNKIDEQTVDVSLLVKLKLAFEEKFRYDADGVPRVWKPEDDIDTTFKNAKDATLSLLSFYSTIKPKDSSLESCIPSELLESDDPDILDYNFSDSRTILTASKQSELSNRLKKEFDAYYLEAKRSLVSSISQIPYWMYLVIGVLGWNEFVAVLRSPVYFMTLIILGFATWMTFKMNLQGPVLTIGTGMINETKRVAQQKLKEYLVVGLFSPMQKNVPKICSNYFFNI
ncbi:RHD3/Sey1 [Phakopsora pachyrhizi]|uniref:RHD3/Sey1 n=1 Tax=Phakopsora pachyrhizi TaxID=170000 RepID=A0AAV0AM58_PHAPC|nr:RHD3/Sey1 [Phakopsora pachyrhizi]CAH7668864.1 RHD3/Sey1 [Phakopsora pachyrhizi]